MGITPRSAWFLVLLALPVAVAAGGFGFWSTVGLLVLWLFVAWALTLMPLARPSSGPALVLESIAPSHFVEKVRWALDRLGLDYEEDVWAGTLGAFYAGRTVPRLHVRNGGVTSRIGTSSDILRFLWGAYGESKGEAAEFLRPTAARLELESRLDAYGADLQRWVYFHLLPHRDLMLRAWGSRDERIPAWQRTAIVALYPVQAALMRQAFRIGERGYAKSVERIEALLEDMNGRLESSSTLLGGDAPDYTDLSFAAMCSLWMQPEAFARGAAERFADDEWPSGLRGDVDRWRAAYPHAVAHVEALYTNDR